MDLLGVAKLTGLNLKQKDNSTPAAYVLEVRRAVAQLLLVNRAGRELLHPGIWFPNSSTERDGSSRLLSHDDHF